MAAQRSSNQGKSADVIVVGAGSAGSAVVRRLVDAGLRVTVLEAGPPDDHEAIHDPTGDIMGLFGSEYDWSYEYLPQRYAGGRMIPQSKGRTLGGSSAINAMFYVRGDAADYNHWAALGAYGWDWASVEPYYRRLENYSEGGAGGRGVGGPVGVLKAPRVNATAEAWLEAAVQAGYPLVDDYNVGDMVGAAYGQLAIFEGRRSSAWVAYVRPIENNPLLTVITRAMVTNLVFDGGRVVGVDYVTDEGQSGEKVRLYADREVVLSAGSIASPQLLLLSGIGDARDLRRLEIPVQVDLPGVGKNLQDHTATYVIYETHDPVPPAGTAVAEANMFLKTRSGLVSPDIQVEMYNVPVPTPGETVPEHGFSLFSMVMHPLSRGSLKLRSSNPFDKPLLDPQYFAEDRDLETAVDSIEPLRAIASQPAMRKYVKAEALPGPARTTREQLRAYARATSGTTYHPVGTAKMGVDSLAVVDPELRVYGVEGLRVADVSVVPALATGNTGGPAMMIGERAADFILGRRAE